MSELPKLRAAGRIVDAVRECLREAIFSGQLVPGEQLSVPDLSRRLEVSRSPVREAVLQLVADGLAIEQPRRGVVVTTVEIGDLLEIHEIREFVEALSARACAERIDAKGIEELRAILNEQLTSVEHGDAAGYFATNARFHAAIGRHARNPRLRDILLSLEGQMRLGLRRVSSDPAQRTRGLAEHRSVLAAIEAGDPDLAEQRMRAHIANTRARLAATAGQAAQKAV